MFQPPVTDCRACTLGVLSGTNCPFQPRQMQGQEQICEQGKRSPIGIVCSGVVALSAKDDDGSVREVALRGPGAIVGAEVLRAGVSAYDVRALGPARVCVVERTALQSWLGSGTPAAAMTGLVIDELARAREDVRARQGGATARLARCLLLLPDLPAGTLPKHLLAESIGMRPETFSRSLRRLVDAGLVDRSTVRVLDREGLVQIAESNEP